jgi:hypothetical protein
LNCKEIILEYLKKNEFDGLLNAVGQLLYRAQQKVADEKRKREVLIRAKIVDEIMKKVSGDLSKGSPRELIAPTKEDLAFLAEQLFGELWSEYQKKILARHEIKPKKLQYTQDMQAPMNQYIGKCGKTDLFKLLIEMALVRNIESRGYVARKKKDPLLAMADRYKVKYGSIAKEVSDSLTEKKKVQTSAKKRKKANDVS